MRCCVSMRNEQPFWRARAAKELVQILALTARDGDIAGSVYDESAQWCFDVMAVGLSPPCHCKAESVAPRRLEIGYLVNFSVWAVHVQAPASDAYVFPSLKVGIIVGIVLTETRNR